MRIPSSFYTLPALLATLFVSSCASSRAPGGWLDEPSEVPRSPYGAWIEVTLSGEDPHGPVAGEFIAVDETDSVYVLTESSFQAIPISSIRAARIKFYRPQTGKALAWTAGGTILSLSHGWGVVITAPVWIIVGSLAAGGVSREPNYDVQRSTWTEMAIYARFPQGLPAGLDRASLKRKVSDGSTVPRYTVTLKDGRILRARGVQYSSAMDFLHVQTVDGDEEDIAAHQVRSIVGSDGKDITRQVMGR